MEEYALEIAEAKRIIDTALFMADSTTSAQLQRRALTQHSDIRVHEAKWLVMRGDGTKARAEVEAVLCLRGAIDDTVVFRVAPSWRTRYCSRTSGRRPRSC